MAKVDKDGPNKSGGEPTASSGKPERLGAAEGIRDWGYLSPEILRCLYT